MPLPIVEFTAEQRELWGRVGELWALSKIRAGREITSMLHPGYVGWDMSTPLPHDRAAAVHSVCAAPADLAEYELRPLSVQVYERQVGVVHYSYSAVLTSKGTASTHVTGKWSEVYLRHNGVWTLISVSGRPEESRDASL